jgi:hypothetical protein
MSLPDGNWPITADGQGTGTLSIQFYDTNNQIFFGSIFDQPIAGAYERFASNSVIHTPAPPNTVVSWGRISFTKGPTLIPFETFSGIFSQYWDQGQQRVVSVTGTVTTKGWFALRQETTATGVQAQHEL